MLACGLVISPLVVAITLVKPNVLFEQTFVICPICKHLQHFTVLMSSSVLFPDLLDCCLLGAAVGTLLLADILMVFALLLVKSSLWYSYLLINSRRHLSSLFAAPNSSW